MSFVIVTKNQYLLCSKIHHIILEEHVNHMDARNSKGRLISVREQSYTINIIYTPEITNTNNNREDRYDCSVTLYSKPAAYRLYKDLIQQIREQMPDALFLNKALEQLLSDQEFAKVEQEDQIDDRKLEVPSDRRTKTLRIPRKAKRSGKKVLRRSSKRRK